MSYIIEQAYTWICAQRIEQEHNNSIWDLRYNWHALKPHLQQQLRTGAYRLSPMQSHYKLKLKMHPDKTFLGCIKKGFDFLGIHFGDTPKISNTGLENHRAKLALRYAQGASAACIGDYVMRWTSWCTGVLKCCSGQLDVIHSMRQEASWQIGHMVLPEENNHEKINFNTSF